MARLPFAWLLKLNTSLSSKVFSPCDNENQRGKLLLLQNCTHTAKYIEMASFLKILYFPTIVV
jgi:hypothetical protein